MHKANSSFNSFFFHLERRAEEEHEAERSEREALLSAIEEHKRLEAEKEERIKNRNVSYQRDLDMQIDYQRRVKSKEMEEEEREFRMGQVSLESRYTCAMQKVTIVIINY